MTENRQRDLEALSAYLDGMLADDERSRFEARLVDEPALRAELEGLRSTRDLLRSAPHYAAPRNFTLTPEMAGARASKPGALFGLARLAFALTTILFAVALVGNFTFQGGALSQPEAITAFEAEPAEAESAPNAADDAAAEQVEEMVEELQALEEAALAPDEDTSTGESAAQPDAVSEEAGVSPEEAASSEGAASPEGESEAVGPSLETDSSEAEESLAPPEGDSQAVVEDAATEQAAGDQADLEGAGEEEDTQRGVEEEAVEATGELPADASTKTAPESTPPPTQDLPPRDGGISRQVNFWSIFVFLTAAAALFSGALTWYLRRR
jgi:anti-sigma factor RsiW